MTPPLHRPFSTQTNKNSIINSPNALTGSLSTGTIIADADAETCVADLGAGNAEVECAYFADPTGDYLLVQLTCPDGQVSLQNGCISTGPEAITGIVQDVGATQCFVNMPATGTYAVTITTTCVEMTIATASGTALKSSLSVKANRAQNIASLIGA